MFFDAHCHAWANWPYQPPVPDPQHRGSVTQLLYEMAQHNVTQALVVCAEIASETANNAYISQAVRAAPGTLYQLAELDSHWKPTYGQPGAAARLMTLLEACAPVGITHYLRDDDEGGWLLSANGHDVLELLGQRGLIFSLHCKPQHFAAVQQAARQHPRLPFLVHHLGHPRAAVPADLEAVLGLASCDNICLKVSGFYYGSRRPAWDFPLSDMQPVVQAVYRRFGARRLFWGSDYPVCGKKGLTYQQTIEKVRTHCAFIPSADLALVMGGALRQLLNLTGTL
jgi:predicted TIM-barrel fold metal-dependent hydrolase